MKSSHFVGRVSGGGGGGVGGDKTALLLELTDAPGALHETLKYFWKYDVNVSHIESRPTNKTEGTFTFFVDYETPSDENAQKALVKKLDGVARSVSVLANKEVPWFPRHASDLDKIADKVLDAGTPDLESDHPGFTDPEYRARRHALAKAARGYRHGDPIPHIDYTAEEQATWTAVWDRLSALTQRHACKEFLDILPQLERHCGYNRSSIPQQGAVSAFLEARTGFRLRPVAGLLSSRDFLNGLAFKTFFCTQYMRHGRDPLYTPEPDLVHELLGHAPMFADPDFAALSQEMGLASLGACDEDVEKLARCYWHSVEFGLLQKPGGEYKAYGAGLLSSFGEMEHACAAKGVEGEKRGEGGGLQPEYRAWDPEDACKQPFPITTYQPVYYVAESLRDAKDCLRRFCDEGLRQRRFRARYHALTERIWVDRALELRKDA